MSKDMPKDEELRPDYAPHEDVNGGKPPKILTESENNEAAMKANFSALLYVITEQQALLGKLLEVMLTNGILSDAQLKKVTEVYGDEDVLQPVYEDVYKRFAWYFMATKEMIMEGAVCPHVKVDLPKNSAEDPDND